MEISKALLKELVEAYDTSQTREMGATAFLKVLSDRGMLKTSPELDNQPELGQTRLQLSSEEINTIVKYRDRCEAVAKKLDLTVYGFTVSEGFSAHYRIGVADPLRIPHWLMERIERLQGSDKNQEAIRSAIKSWMDKQGHDRCWYYPDIFKEIANILGIEVKMVPQMQKEEFIEGCNKFVCEQFDGQGRPTWSSTGRYCDNCGEMLSNHVDQKYCPYGKMTLHYIKTERARITDSMSNVRKRLDDLVRLCPHHWILTKPRGGSIEAHYQCEACGSTRHDLPSSSKGDVVQT